MAFDTPEVDLTGINDPQQPIAFVVGVLLIVVGIAGLSGIVDMDIGYGQGLVVGAFGIPVWLGVTAIVAGLLGIVLSTYQGAGTTFNKVAAGLVLPAVLFLAIVDWGIAVGDPLALVVGLLALVLAVVLVVVGGIIFYKHPLSLVLPIVAVLAVADWVVGITALAPASEPVNLPTLGLLVVLELVVGLVAFEGGRRITDLE